MLPELADQLGELADAARFTLNAAHNAAVPYPPPSELNGTRTDTAGFAAATRSGTAYLALIDRSTGAVATTFAIDVGAPRTPAGLVGPDPGRHGRARLGRRSTATGRVRIAAAPGYGLALSEGDSSIVATDDAGHGRSYGLAHYLGLNDLLVRAGVEPTGLQVRGDIAGDARRLSRVPPRRRARAAHGRSARRRRRQSRRPGARRRLREPGRPRSTRGDLPAGSFRLADYAAEIVAVRAGAAERAKSAAANDQALADDLSARRAEVAGVNLDEELSRLVLYQQAYSVSARLISITGQLFDELLAIGK